MAHWQIKLVGGLFAMHTPKFWHGPDEHALVSEKKNNKNFITFAHVDVSWLRNTPRKINCGMELWWTVQNSSLLFGKKRMGHDNSISFSKTYSYLQLTTYPLRVAAYPLPLAIYVPYPCRLPLTIYHLPFTCYRMLLTSFYLPYICIGRNYKCKLMLKDYWLVKCMFEYAGKHFQL